MRDLRKPPVFVDDFTLTYTDACIGASCVQFVGDAMRQLRYQYPLVADDEVVMGTYWVLCDRLVQTFTLHEERDGSKREFDPDRNDEESDIGAWASSDDDRIWGYRVDADSYLEDLHFDDDTTGFLLNQPDTVF